MEMYITIPASLLEANISPRMKLLCGHLHALMNKYGFCFASNKYLAKAHGLHPVQISRMLGELNKKGYIRIDREDGRKIYPGAGQIATLPSGQVGSEKAPETPPVPLNKNVNAVNESVNGLNETVNGLNEIVNAPDPVLLDENKSKIKDQKKVRKTFAPPDGSAQATLFDLEEEPAPQVASQPPKPKKQPKPKATPSAEIPAAFAAFWEAYPRNLGYFRPAALAAWNKANPTPEQAAQIMAGLDDWKRYWEDRQTHWEYMPLPAKFLKEERWKYGSEVRSKAHTTLDRNARFYYHGPSTNSSTANQLPGPSEEVLARAELITDEQLDREMEEFHRALLNS